MTRSTATSETGRWGHGHITPPKNFKPPRDRRIMASALVPCPDCKKPIGERCINADGNMIMGSHRSRRRMAIRKENES